MSLCLLYKSEFIKAVCDVAAGTCPVRLKLTVAEAIFFSYRLASMLTDKPSG